MNKKINELADFLTKISYRNEMRDFFGENLTEREGIEIWKRWKILGELEKGEITQREIAKKWGVSLNTVVRWKKRMK